jgi:hypothetical protein
VTAPGKKGFAAGDSGRLAARRAGGTAEPGNGAAGSGPTCEITAGLSPTGETQEEAGDGTAGSGPTHEKRQTSMAIANNSPPFSAISRKCS